MYGVLFGKRSDFFVGKALGHILALRDVFPDGPAFTPAKFFVRRGDGRGDDIQHLLKEAFIHWYRIKLYLLIVELEKRFLSQFYMSNNHYHALFFGFFLLHSP